MAGVADAAADQDGSEEGFGEHAAGEGVAVHFADFGKTCEVDLFADELRERGDSVQVAGSADEILVANQFIQAVGAEASYAAEKIDGSAEGGVAEGGGAVGGEEEGAARGNGLEVLDEKFERRVGVGGDGSGVEPLEICFEVDAAGGDDGFVGVIEDVAHVEGADAPVGGGEVRSAEAQGVILIADAVADADFVEAAEGIAEIDAGENVVETIDRARVRIFVDLEIGLGGVDVGGEKPFSQRLEGAIEFGGDSVGGAKFQIGAPLGAVAQDVHRGDARAHG